MKYVLLAFLLGGAKESSPKEDLKQKKEKVSREWQEVKKRFKKFLEDMK